MIDGVTTYRFWVRMLESMGGSYTPFYPKPDPPKSWQHSQPNYLPAHEIRQRPLNPRAYYTDANGSIRRRKAA